MTSKKKKKTTSVNPFVGSSCSGVPATGEAFGLTFSDFGLPGRAGILCRYPYPMPQPRLQRQKHFLIAMADSGLYYTITSSVTGLLPAFTPPGTIWCDNHLPAFIGPCIVDQQLQWFPLMGFN